jgi:hypothetical protein
MATKLTFTEERTIENLLTKKLPESYFKNFDEEIQKSDEIGHSHGPGVQKIVGKLLSEHCELDYEKDKKGNPIKRAFSDNIIKGNPNNVKFTTKNSSGQPNLVSMNRMIKHVFENHNDTYYVTVVHYDMTTKTVDVKLVNILQFIDCLSYNSGPGQIMIKTEIFDSEYKKYIKNERPVKDYYQITKELAPLVILEREKHIQLRQEQLIDFKSKYIN